jgi:hypothetical protein
MKRTVTEFGASALAFTMVLALTGVAHAQDAAPAAGGQAQVGGGAHAGGGAGMTLPGEGRPARAAETGDSDHDQFIGTFGIGLLGARTLNVGCSGEAGGGVACGGAAGPSQTAINAPVIGVRYWLTEMIGIDAGIGIGINSFGESVAGQDQNLPSATAFLLHGGVPLALASAGHFTFEVIPEMNIGFSSWSQDRQGERSLSGSGFHFDVGARAGAEIHFGFIGIPNLALQGTVGLLLSTESTSIENTGNAANTTVKFSTTTFGTTLQGDPWDIFTSNISALYYF